jgi:hypothetical protein
LFERKISIWLPKQFECRSRKFLWFFGRFFARLNCRRLFYFVLLKSFSHHISYYPMNPVESVNKKSIIIIQERSATQMKLRRKNAEKRESCRFHCFYYYFSFMSSSEKLLKSLRKRLSFMFFSLFSIDKKKSGEVVSWYNHVSFHSTLGCIWWWWKTT